MKLRLLSAAFVSIACTAGLFAQTTPQMPKSSSDKAITVTGCVQRAQASPTGTSGTTASTSSTAAMNETKFVLTNITTSPSATTGTSGTAGRSANEYRLDASDAKLTPHVGHKVEITGTVEDSASSPSSTASPTASTSSSAPKLKVDNVKMIATSCS